MSQRVHVITLGVRDVERSREFYEKVLSWEASCASQDDSIFFQSGGMVFALFPRKLLAQDATVTNAGSGFSGITMAHLVKNKAEVAELLSKAVAGGARLVKPAQDVFWGGHSGYFSDLDGHLWEVAWNPFWELKEDGSVILPQKV